MFTIKNIHFTVIYCLVLEKLNMTSFELQMTDA